MTFTEYHTVIPASVLKLYMSSLIDRFFKILPMREDEEPSLCEYMDSFLRELLGMESLIVALHNDPMYLSLVSILRYLIDNPACEVSIVRKEVFHAISMCKKLSEKYASLSDFDYGCSDNAVESAR